MTSPRGTCGANTCSQWSIRFQTRLEASSSGGRSVYAVMLKTTEPEVFGDASSLRLLINAVIDYAIYMIDLDGRVLTWNAGAVRLKGYSAEEIIGQPFTRFYTSEDIRAELPQKALRAARETGRFDAEGWRVRKDGTRFWASVVVDAV